MQYAAVVPVGRALGPLTYQVPADLRDHVTAGVRVLVPLGRQQLVGYVIGDAEAPEQEPKPIAEVLDELPLLTRGQLALVQFAARYYLTPLAEALRAAHPRGAEVIEHRTITLTDEGRLAREHSGGLLAVQGLELAATEKRLLDLLAERPYDSAELLKRAKQRGPRHLQSLVRRGFATQSAAAFEPKVAPATERWAILAPQIELEAALAEVARAPKQAALLQQLGDAGGEAAVSALRAFDPAASTRLRQLAERGFVAFERRERRRDPYADVEETTAAHAAPQLNVAQSHAVGTMTAALREGRFHPFLLEGVTGSGKTEVYLHVIDEALQAGRGAIVLVPEISLTPQLAGRFRARFPDNVAVLHSALSAGERVDEWRRVRAGTVQVVVGARSAIFAPVEPLGVIVVDEEHDGSFKQEDGLRYHARDLALVRGQYEKAVVILGSATPSLEAYHNAQQGKLRRIELPERATPHPLPDVEVIDLKRWKTDKEGVLSAPLAKALTAALEADGQAIIFLNRRGFAPFMLCLTCGTPVRCAHCSVSLTLHKRRQILLCHYCGHHMNVPPQCPGCQAENLRALGLGTERVEQCLRDRFPGARVARLDRDTSRGKGLRRILGDFAARRVDILVGTQMVTKGHDFPGVTLVGVIQADQALHLPDFRASERTFQLLSQVAGRAGRGGTAGRVLIQTYNPLHHAVTCAQSHDYATFAKTELRFRSELGYPPTGHLVCVRLESLDPDEVERTAHLLGDVCEDARDEAVKILGPVPAPIAKVRDRSRWQIVLKGASRPPLHTLAREAKRWARDNKPEGVRVLVDVDPQNLL